MDRLVVDAIHLEQLREHGGLHGVRDENVLESALARPRNTWAYEHDADLATLAAAYACGLATSHPFRDGNKRVAFLVMITFLGLNGWDFEALESDVVTTMLAVADHRCLERDLAGCIRDHSVASP